MSSYHVSPLDISKYILPYLCVSGYLTISLAYQVICQSLDSVALILTLISIKAFHVLNLKKINYGINKENFPSTETEFINSA
jgi:hypothetical protein